jgi:single-stranded-DNA-specific exonuclease
MLNKRWTIRKIDDDYPVKLLADQLKISEVIARLLVLRNITNFNLAKSFFRPSLNMLYDPFLMDGMETSSYRKIQAIAENQ